MENLHLNLFVNIPNVFKLLMIVFIFLAVKMDLLKLLFNLVY